MKEKRIEYKLKLRKEEISKQIRSKRLQICPSKAQITDQRVKGAEEKKN